MRRPKEYWVPSELALYDKLKDTPEFQDRPAIYDRENGLALIRGALKRISEDALNDKASRLWDEWFYDNPNFDALQAIYPKKTFTFA